jgi:hypothetical protein
MASIESLLNPLPNITSFSQSKFHFVTDSLRDEKSLSLHPGKQKVAKDAPVFIRGKIRGELRYPPCEDQDEELAETHQEFEIHPMGRIAQFPRHIPYNSEKKSFLEKTGRDSFEGDYTSNPNGDEGVLNNR